jgi:hypothetical protein
MHSLTVPAIFPLFSYLNKHLCTCDLQIHMGKSFNRLSSSIADFSNLCLHLVLDIKYSASHLRVAPENVGLQKEQKYNTFACHTCNEVRLCVLVIHIQEVGNTKR